MVMPSWVSDPDSLILTEDQYDDLPDQVRKLIEVIDGHVIFCQSGTPEHSDVGRRLANRLEAAKPAEPCTRVSTDIDVHFVKRKRIDSKLSFRRPDVSIYRCIERGAKLSARDALLQMIHEYRLDWATRTYRLAQTHVAEIILEDPFPAIVQFAELDG